LLPAPVSGLDAQSVHDGHVIHDVDGLVEALVVGYVNPTYRDPIVFGGYLPRRFPNVRG